MPPKATVISDPSRRPMSSSFMAKPPDRILRGCRRRRRRCGHKRHTHDPPQLHFLPMMISLFSPISAHDQNVVQITMQEVDTGLSSHVFWTTMYIVATGHGLRGVTFLLLNLANLQKFPKHGAPTFGRQMSNSIFFFISVYIMTSMNCPTTQKAGSRVG